MFCPHLTFQASSVIKYGSLKKRVAQMHCLSTYGSFQDENISFPVFICSILQVSLLPLRSFLIPTSELIACYVSLYFTAQLFVFTSPPPFPPDCEDHRAQPTVGTKQISAEWMIKTFVFLSWSYVTMSWLIFYPMDKASKIIEGRKRSFTLENTAPYWKKLSENLRTLYF